MSLLIVNTESDLLIELQVTEFVAELLKLQCERKLPHLTGTR